AGLDYWPHVNITYYNNIQEFLRINKNANMVFLSSHGIKNHWDISFEDNLFLVFGKESVGLPKSLTEKYPDKLFKIPLFSEHVRSLNLANALRIVVYDGIKHENHYFFLTSCVCCSWCNHFKASSLSEKILKFHSLFLGNLSKTSVLMLAILL